MDSDELCDFETLESLVESDQEDMNILASLVAGDSDCGDKQDSHLSVAEVKHVVCLNTQTSKKNSAFHTNEISDLTVKHSVLAQSSQNGISMKDNLQSQNIISQQILTSQCIINTETIQTDILLEEMAKMQKKMLELQKMLEQQQQKQVEQQKDIQNSGGQNLLNESAIEKKTLVKDNTKDTRALSNSQRKETSVNESTINGSSADAKFRLVSDNDFFFSQSRTNPSNLQKFQKGLDDDHLSAQQKVLVNQTDMKKDLFGDSDSDWEMDSEDKQTLSEVGKDIKKLLHSNQDKREAHTPKFGVSDISHRTFHSWTRRSSEMSLDTGRSSSICNTKVDQRFDKDTLHCKISSKAQAITATKPSDCDQFVTEDYSKIRIINPLISSSLMKLRMEGRKMVSVSKIHLKLKTADLQGDWVTIAVIVGKTDSKSSSTGKPYSIWRLSDLEDVDNVVSFFLFGEVHKQLWKTDIGTVIGVLNPSIMESMEKKNSEPAFTIKSAGQLMIMGRSKDLGWCIGRTKKGNKCFKFINKKFGDYCSYHVQAAYRKVSASRLELHGSFAGAKPKSFEQKIFSKDCSYIYGGQTFVPHTSGKSKKNITLKKLQNNMSVSTQNKISTMSLHNIKPEQMDSKKRTAQDDHDSTFLDMISVPSPGSMNLVAFLKNKDTNVSSCSSQGSQLIHMSQVQSITANELLKQHKQFLQDKKTPKRKASDQLLAYSDAVKLTLRAEYNEEISKCAQTTVNVFSQVPVLAKGFYTGQEVSLDSSKRPMSTADRAKLKAIMAIKVKGGVKQEDPNAVKKYFVDIDKINKKIQESASAECSTQESSASTKQSSHGEPPKKKSRLLGNINLNSDEIKNIMKARSKHKGALSEAEAEREQVFFNELEKKETLEEKLQSVTSIQITVITCKQCSYTAQSAKDSCKQDGHTLIRTKTKKRFFMCKKCKQRTDVIGGKFPTETCRKCGAQAFEKTSMYKEKAGPTLESEVLNIRGDEIKYLNSMNQKIYLQTVIDS